MSWLILIVGGVFLLALKPLGEILTSQSVIGPTRRVEVPGVAVQIPGEDWSSVPLAPEEIALAERTYGYVSSPDGLIRLLKKGAAILPNRPEDVRLVYATVLAFGRPDESSPTPDELLAEFKGNTHPGQNVTGRQRLVSLDATPDLSLGATCVKYHRVTEMTGALAAVGPRRFPDATFVLEGTGFYCVHPRWRQYVIDVHYDQLYAQGEPSLPLEEERTAFLQSVVFTASRPVASADIGGDLRARMRAGIDAFDRKQWAEAEVAFQTALRAVRQLGDSAAPAGAGPLYYLAFIALENGRSDAESLYREALDLFEKYPEIQEDSLFGATLNDLGIIYARQGQFDRAEPLMLRGLTTREKTLGGDHPDVLRSLSSLATLYGQSNRWPELETFARRALPLVERDNGPGSPSTRDMVLSLAYACLLQGKVADGLSFMTRFLSIAKVANYPEAADDIRQLAEILRSLGLNAEAAELERTPLSTPR